LPVSETDPAPPLEVRGGSPKARLCRRFGRSVLPVLAILLIAATFRPVVEGDGVGYFAYLHAVLVSHSLDFSSEYSAAISAHVPLFFPLVTTRTATGRLANFFPVGSAILGSPAYVVALALHPSGEPQYGSPFVEAFTLSSLLFGLIALAISYRIAVAIVRSRRAALVGVIGAAMATPLVYYALSDPSYSHTFSIFCVSLFLYVWWTGPPQTWPGWFGLGLLGGLMALTRFQDGLLVALVLVDTRRLRLPTLAFIPGTLVAFSPQLVVDQVQFGTWLPQRPLGQALDPLHGQYIQALFSSIDGLFVWTPVALIAAVGFLFVSDRRMKVACGIAFLVEVLIIGWAPDTVGAAFGPRRFLDLIPFAVIGLAAAAARFGPRLDWPVIGAFCVWNLVLVTNFEYVMAHGRDPGYAGLISGQLKALPYIPRLAAKGAAIRDLVLWKQAHEPFNPIGGLSLLALETASVAAAWVVARRLKFNAIAAGNRASASELGSIP
jgi:hypothetical protein